MSRTNVNEIVNNILRDRGVVTNREVAEKAQVTRQAVHRYLSALVESGQLVAEGAGRGVRYRRAGSTGVHFHYRRDGLAEDVVWGEMQDKLERLSTLGEPAKKLVQYAFAELLNNAIEHSQSPGVEVMFEVGGEKLAFEVIDQGVGIFDHVTGELHLTDKLESIQQLSKGKLTTDPAHHTGEGIFFVSKCADVFEIDSGGLRWLVDNLRNDTTVVAAENRKGTRVRFEVSASKTLALDQLFAEFTKDYRFVKTRILIKLFEIGNWFMSRSEGRRLMGGLERFEEAVLDFAGVEGVGQGFVDEVFRVWANAHPATALLSTNMGKAVEFMVRRGLNHGK